MYSVFRVARVVAAVVFVTSVWNNAYCGQVRTVAQVQVADIRLYEHDVQARDENVTEFDRLHPMAGKVLGDDQFYEHELNELKEHPRCFEREYSCLSRLLEGEKLYDERHRNAPPVVPDPVPPATSDNKEPGNGIQGASVPEPASGVLMFTAAAAGAIVATRRARSRPVTNERRARTIDAW